MRTSATTATTALSLRRPSPSWDEPALEHADDAPEARTRRPMPKRTDRKTTRDDEGQGCGDERLNGPEGMLRAELWVEVRRSRDPRPGNGATRLRGP
jgi:hypothetical protein